MGRTAIGEELTLVNCQRVGRQKVVARRGGGSEEKIRCPIALRGRHVRRPTDAIWKRARLLFDNLDEWAFRTAFVSDYDGGVASDGTVWTSIRLSNSPDIVVALDTGTVTIGQGRAEEQDGNSFSFSRVAQITFESRAPIPLEGFDDAFIAPMRYFLAFATDARNRVRTMKVAGPVIDRYGAHRVLRDLDVVREWSGGSHEERADYDMLLPLSALGERAGAVIANWFALFSSRRNALDLMLSASLGERMFLEARFLTLAQAAEVYHRSAYPDGVLDDRGHATRVRAVLDAAPPRSTTTG